MAITCITHDYAKHIDLKSEVFVGRVLRVEKVSETRNWSDTMDYSDYRTTECTYALVWLGTHGIPPEYINTARPRAHWGSLPGPHEQLHDLLADRVRDLEYFEQFAWVDCTNLHGDRMAHRLVNPVVDATIDSGEPLMLTNLIAWDGYQKASDDQRLRKAEAAAEEGRKAKAEAEAKAAARAAKSEAKLAATKDEAAVLIAKLPPKGTKVTVKGITGQLFWSGIKAYRGVNSARIGVKDSTGTTHWFAAADLVG